MTIGETCFRKRLGPCGKFGQRLLEHKGSVLTAKNLDINSVWFRYLVVEDIWIPVGESLLLQKYQPLWNRLIEGFGNHDPEVGRYNGKRPVWDELHPGRSWATKCTPPKWNEKEILEHVKNYMGQISQDET